MSDVFALSFSLQKHVCILFWALICGGKRVCNEYFALRKVSLIPWDFCKDILRNGESRRIK